MYSNRLELLDTVHQAVDGLVETVGDGGIRDLTHDELTELTAAVRREQARLDSVLMEAVGEVDARGSYIHDGALTAGAWLRMTARLTPGEAAASVRTARVLRSGALPRVRAALGAGEVSGEHARVIARAVSDAPAGAVALIEPEALRVARAADPGAVAGVMRRFAHALDPDGADEAAVRRYQRRGVSLATTLDGMVVGTVLLDPVAGAQVLTALSAASAPVSGDARSACQRTADALSDICRQFLATAQDRKSGGGHPHLIITLDAETLQSTPAVPARPVPRWAGSGRSTRPPRSAPAATPTSPMSR